MTNRGTIEQLFIDLWSRGNIDTIDDIYSDAFEAHYHHPPMWGAGKAGVKTLVLSVRSAFPDYCERVLDLLEEEDRIAVRIRITGTNLGPLGTTEPTGRSVDFEEIIIFRLEHGKVREQWGVPDMLALYEQLGLLAVPIEW
jgi:predicted ester cyclase